MAEEAWKSLKPVETVIYIPGLTREYSVMQITDSHLTEADDREEEGILRKSKDRERTFVDRAREHTGLSTSEIFLAHLQLCNENQVDCAVFTGDLIDFPSFANLDFIRSGFQALTTPYLYTLGNHDWNYPHLAASDELRTQFYPRFQEWFNFVPGCDVLDIGGVKLIAVDNSNYQLTWEQVHFIQEHAHAQQICLLFMHIPIYLHGLEGDVLARWGAPIMMAAEGWTLQTMNHWKVRETDASTSAFMQWVTKTENHQIMGIFCGHVHFSHKDSFCEGRFQYITEPGFQGGSRLIRLKSAN